MDNVLDSRSLESHTLLMSSLRALPFRDEQTVRSTQGLAPDQSLAIIRTLVAALPADAREQLARELAQAELAHEATPTGVLATVISLLPSNTTVTVAELKKQVVQRGVEAEPKEIYNAVGYLAKKGKLRRVGYGRYVVDGVEIATSDDLGGPTSRHEDPYRTDPTSGG